jgi:hemolysin activation/secretion protein
LPGDIQLIGFFDTGTVNTYQHSWASGSNTRTLNGAGVGVNWMAANNFAVKAYYAHRIGNERVQSGPDQSGQFWVQVVKYF